MTTDSGTYSYGRGRQRWGNICKTGTVTKSTLKSRARELQYILGSHRHVDKTKPKQWWTPTGNNAKNHQNRESRSEIHRETKKDKRVLEERVDTYEPYDDWMLYWCSSSQRFSLKPCVVSIYTSNKLRMINRMISHLSNNLFHFYYMLTSKPIYLAAG